MWVLDVEVIEEEHSVEGFHEELDLLWSGSGVDGTRGLRTYEHVCCDQKRKANIIWSVCFLYQLISTGL